MPSKTACGDYTFWKLCNKKYYIFQLETLDSTNKYLTQVESLCTTPRTMEVISNPSVISINFENNNTLTCTAGEKCYINITMTQIHRLDNRRKCYINITMTQIHRLDNAAAN